MPFGLSNKLPLMQGKCELFNLFLAILQLFGLWKFYNNYRIDLYAVFLKVLALSTTDTFTNTIFAPEARKKLYDFYRVRRLPFMETINVEWFVRNGNAVRDRFVTSRYQKSKEQKRHLKLSLKARQTCHVRHDMGTYDNCFDGPTAPTLVDDMLLRTRLATFPAWPTTRGGGQKWVL